MWDDTVITQKPMRKKLLLHSFFLVLASLITISTAFKSVEVLNKSNLNHLSCGWPIQYANNGFGESRWDPPYPWTIRCINGGWGDPIRIYWPQFVIDVAFFYTVIVLLSFGIGGFKLLTQRIR